MKTEQELGNLMISGLGSSNGGHFDTAMINGKGTLNGDLFCNSFVCNGSVTVSGDVKSENIKIAGYTKIKGKVYATEMTVDGRSSFSGDVFFNKMKIAGSTSIGGTVKGEELNVQGKISVDGDCEVETFKSEGQFDIGGLLSAEKIEICTNGACKAKEIGGQTIKVTQKNNLLLDFLKVVKSVKLQVDSIEGDDIFLENTKAKIVRGQSIIIGQNCEIDYVEYKDTLKIVGNGHVKKSVQL